MEDRIQSDVLKVTVKETHHYFVANPTTGEMMEDKEGNALVFTSRQKAHDHAAQTKGVGGYNLRRMRYG